MMIPGAWYMIRRTTQQRNPAADQPKPVEATAAAGAKARKEQTRAGGPARLLAVCTVDDAPH